jgi:hypothetical protein
LSSSSWQIGELVVDDGARSVSRAGVRLELTRTEYDLLSMLAQHVGKVLSKTQLLTSVWGFDAYDANLVEVHMSALRRKLELHGPGSSTPSVEPATCSARDHESRPPGRLARQPLAAGARDGAGGLRRPRR